METMIACQQPQGLMPMGQELLPNGAHAREWLSDSGQGYISITRPSGDVAWFRLVVETTMQALYREAYGDIAEEREAACLN